MKDKEIKILANEMLKKTYFHFVGQKRSDERDNKLFR